MGVETCLHCGSPVLAGTARYPQCRADLTGEAEPPHPRELRPTPPESGWERLEIPLLDLPFAFRVILDPGVVSPLNAKATAGKHASRALVLSVIGLALTLVPMLGPIGVLPAIIGMVWSIAALRTAHRHRVSARRATAWAAFGLGLATVVITALAVLVALAARGSTA